MPEISFDGPEHRPEASQEDLARKLAGLIEVYARRRLAENQAALGEQQSRHAVTRAGANAVEGKREAQVARDVIKPRSGGREGYQRAMRTQREAEARGENVVAVGGYPAAREADLTSAQVGGRIVALAAINEGNGAERSEVFMSPPRFTEDTVDMARQEIEGPLAGKADFYEMVGQASVVGDAAHAVDMAIDKTVEEKGEEALPLMDASKGTSRVSDVLDETARLRIERGDDPMPRQSIGFNDEAQIVSDVASDMARVAETERTIDQALSAIEGGQRHGRPKGSAYEAPEEVARDLRAGLLARRISARAGLPTGRVEVAERAGRLRNTIFSAHLSKSPSRMDGQMDQVVRTAMAWEKARKDKSTFRKNVHDPEDPEPASEEPPLALAVVQGEKPLPGEALGRGHGREETRRPFVERAFEHYARSGFAAGIGAEEARKIDQEEAAKKERDERMRSSEKEGGRGAEADRQSPAPSQRQTSPGGAATRQTPTRQTSTRKTQKQEKEASSGKKWDGGLSP